MKYKNIELKEGKDSETELLCAVEFKNDDCDDNITEEMEDTLLELFTEFKNNVEIETVTDDLILVRCGDITFDEKGIKILKSIYDKLVAAKLGANITVDVHVDGEEWFKDENGEQYNEDQVTYEEFLKCIEY